MNRDLQSKNERLKSDLKSTTENVYQQQNVLITLRQAERDSNRTIEQKAAEIESVQKEAELLRFENIALKEGQDRSARDIGQRDFMIDRLQTQIYRRRQFSNC